MYCVLFLTACSCSTLWGRASDEPPGIAWAAEYNKLGGDAVLGSKDDRSIGIGKKAGQKPLVSLAGLNAPHGIQRVVLQGFEITDADLMAIAEWQDLETVEICDGKLVGDKGLVALSKLPKLKVLFLSEAAITGDGLLSLSGHKSLARLHITSSILPCRIRNLALKNMPALERLSMNGEGPESITLSNMPKLTELGEFPTTLKSAKFSSLGALMELDFHGTRLEQLSLDKLPNIEMIDLRKTRMDDKSLDGIERAWPAAKVKR